MGNTAIQPINKPTEIPIEKPSNKTIEKPIEKINQLRESVEKITKIPIPGDMKEIPRSRVRKVQTIPLNDSETIPRMPRHKEQANNKILEHQYFSTTINNDSIPERIETRENLEETLWKFKKEMDYRLGVSQEPRENLEQIRGVLDNEQLGTTEIEAYSDYGSTPIGNQMVVKGYEYQGSPMTGMIVNQISKPTTFMEPEQVRQLYDPLELLKYEKLGKYNSYFDMYNKLLGLYTSLLIIHGYNHPQSLVITNTIELLNQLPTSQTQLILVMGSLKKCYI
jgi:hypothetical protein